MGAISDYSTLTNAVVAYLKRADLASIIPTFVQLAESRLNRDVKSPRMLLTDTGTISNYTIYLPAPASADDAAFIEIASLTVTAGNRDLVLEPVPPARALDQTVGAYPRAFYVSGDSIITIGGSGSEDYRLVYKASLPTITAGANFNTNWLLSKAPEMYLYAVLMEASPYLKNDERIAVWSAGYEQALSTLNTQESMVSYAPTPRMMPVHNAP